MSLESAPYYWLTCDLCGIKSTEDQEYAAWGDVDQAESHAEESDWFIEGGNHLCWDCTPLDREDRDE